jgi:peptidoglycan/xylan/chitin deacetylase (PgdA/CDA1 family)
MVLLRGRARRIAWLAHDVSWMYPTLRRNCDWHGPVVTHFDTEEREVWLTIDDGPDPRDTPEILDLLAAHNARATFFVVGKKVEQNRALCRRIRREGHTLGNHTHTHPAALWWAMPRLLARREMGLCNNAILTATGEFPRFFRSPVGMNNFAVHPSARHHGLCVTGWSADGCDGCPSTPTRTVSRIMSSVRPGSIILIHESGTSSHRPQTIARLLATLKSEGYRCVLPEEISLL